MLTNIITQQRYHGMLMVMSMIFCFDYSTLPSKRNTTLGSGAPMTPIWGQLPHRGKQLLTGVVSPISSHTSSLKIEETTPVNNFLPLWGS